MYVYIIHYIYTYIYVCMYIYIYMCVCVQLFVTPWTDCSLPGFPALHHLLEFAQTHSNIYN